MLATAGVLAAAKLRLGHSNLCSVFSEAAVKDLGLGRLPFASLWVAMTESSARRAVIAVNLLASIP